MPAQTFKLVVLISGNGSNLQSIIDHIQAGTLDAGIMAVISNRADAFGLDRARSAGIEALTMEPGDYSSACDFDQALANTVSRYQPDLIALAGYMRILGAAFVDRFEGKIVNIHPSLLPKYKGLNTHQRVIDAGDAEHGASVHYVTHELDDGPIIIQRRVEISPHDTAATLQQKVHQAEHRIYPIAIQRIVTGEVNFNRIKPES